MKKLRRLWCRLRGHDGLPDSAWTYTYHKALDATWIECRCCGRGFWNDRLSRPFR